MIRNTQKTDRKIKTLKTVTNKNITSYKLCQNFIFSMFRYCDQENFESSLFLLNQLENNYLLIYILYLLICLHSCQIQSHERSV